MYGDKMVLKSLRLGNAELKLKEFLSKELLRTLNLSIMSSILCSVFQALFDPEPLGQILQGKDSHTIVIENKVYCCRVFFFFFFFAIFIVKYT